MLPSEAIQRFNNAVSMIILNRMLGEVCSLSKRLELQSNSVTFFISPNSKVDEDMTQGMTAII